MALKTVIASAVAASLLAPASAGSTDLPRAVYGGLDVVSTDVSRTAAGVRGHEAAVGTLKVSHDPSAAGALDPNAAAVSIRMDGITAAQGIYIDAPDGSTGKTLNFRQQGREYLTLLPPHDGQPARLLLNGKPVLTGP